MNKPCFSRLSLVLVAGLVLFLSSCSGKKVEQSMSDFLVRVGDEYLTSAQVARAVPAGLSPDDSTAFATGYIKQWIDTRLVSEYAATEVDMTEIDRLTEEYRNSLILNEYRRRLFNSQADSIPEDTIVAYYEAHKGDFVTDRPFVRGVYLKVPDRAANIRILRRLYQSDKPADIDRLEKESLSSAIHYDYFRDRWVDWEQIESRIPYDFGDNSMTWLRQHKTLDYSAGSFVFLLHIVEVLPPGTTMPLEIARPTVVSRLLNAQRHRFDEMISRNLYSRALESGRLEVRI